MEIRIDVIRMGDFVGERKICEGGFGIWFNSLKIFWLGKYL